MQRKKKAEGLDVELVLAKKSFITDDTCLGVGLAESTSLFTIAVLWRNPSVEEAVCRGLKPKYSNAKAIPFRMQTMSGRCDICCI